MTTREYPTAFMKKIKVLGLAFSLCAFQAFAQEAEVEPEVEVQPEVEVPPAIENRYASDAAFVAPRGSAVAQTLLGLADLVLAGWAYPGLGKEASAVRRAEVALEKAMDLPLDEEMRMATIQAIETDPDSYVSSRLRGTVLSPAAKQRINSLREASTVSSSDKRKIVLREAQNVSKARKAGFMGAQHLGLIDRSVRFLRKGAALLFVIDGVARVYVWHALEADPTFTPVGHYLMEQISGSDITYGVDRLRSPFRREAEPAGEPGGSE